MKPHLRPATYLIHTYSGPRWKKGFIVLSPAFPPEAGPIGVHFNGSTWNMDHLNTGLRFGDLHDNIDECIKNGLAVMTQNVESGALERAINRVGCQGVGR